MQVTCLLTFVRARVRYLNEALVITGMDQRARPAFGEQLPSGMREYAAVRKGTLHVHRPDALFH